MHNLGDTNNDLAMHSVKPLLIFDLNGTLLHRLTNSVERRAARNHPVYIGPSFFVRGNPCYLRPHLHAFLKAMFERFEISVWTSAKPMNAIPMTVQAFSGLLDLSDLLTKLRSNDVCYLKGLKSEGDKKLLFLWTQEECIIGKRSDAASHKPKFTKDLCKVWAAYPQYTYKNTFIVDDTASKLMDEHLRNHLHVSEFRVDLEDIDYTKDDALQHLAKELLEIGDMDTIFEKISALSLHK